MVISGTEIINLMSTFKMNNDPFTLKSRSCNVEPHSLFEYYSTRYNMLIDSDVSKYCFSDKLSSDFRYVIFSQSFQFTSNNDSDVKFDHMFRNWKIMDRPLFKTWMYHVKNHVQAMDVPWITTIDRPCPNHRLVMLKPWMDHAQT